MSGPRAKPISHRPVHGAHVVKWQRESADWKVAVVLPCYRSRRHVLDVISKIGPTASLIVVVDDACPEHTGAHVEEHCSDQRVTVLYNESNLGVGGAVIRGYQWALSADADIAVKLDSDGQMDAACIPKMIQPIVAGHADYVKGNRFFHIEGLASMPKIRILGNACLSFFTKLSSGYWNVFDPTNGYTAIHRVALKMLPLGKIDSGFFFETDLLFRLNLTGAVVVDVPISARYYDEQSNLKIRHVVFPFLAKNLRNACKRIFYRYYLRDLNIGSLELLTGIALLLFGTIFGSVQWAHSAAAEVPATAGTVMLAGLPVLVGIQLILGFFAFDFLTVPKVPLQVILGDRAREVDNAALCAPTQL